MFFCAPLGSSTSACLGHGCPRPHACFSKVSRGCPKSLTWDVRGPVRDTPPYRAIPFRDSIAEGVSHPFALFWDQNRTAKSTHHPHKIDDQHRECKTGGGAYFAFFLGSDNSHTTPPKIPPDEEGLLWGWCVVRGPLQK